MAEPVDPWIAISFSRRRRPAFDKDRDAFIADRAVREFLRAFGRVAPTEKCEASSGIAEVGGIKDKPQ